MKRMIVILTICAAAVGALVTVEGQQGATTTARGLYEQARHQEDGVGDLPAAIALYQRALAANPDRALATTIRLHIGICYALLGKPDGREFLEAVQRDSGDRREVTEARSWIERLGVNEVAPPLKPIWPGHDFVSPSPDGRYLAWVNYGDTSAGTLTLHNLATGKDSIVRPADRGSFADDPYFTRDGKKLLFMWYEAVTDKWSVRTIHVDGSNERVIDADYAKSGPISPDGRFAAVSVTQNGVQQLAMLNLDSGKVTVLESVGWRQPEVGNFSPDGSYFVYSALLNQDSETREIYTMAVDGSSKHKIVPEPGINLRPFFSPDGARVLFVSNRATNRWDLWSVPVARGMATGIPVVLKADVGRLLAQGIASDGTMFFSQSVGQKDIYTAEIDPATWTAKGAPRLASGNFLNVAAGARWSPDGKWLAFTSNLKRAEPDQPTDLTVVLRSTETGKEQAFSVPVRSAGGAGAFTWYPDSKKLLLSEYPSAGTRPFRWLDFTTGEVKMVFEAPLQGDRILSAVISPDGRFVYYSSNEGDRPSAADHVTRLVRRDLESGEEREVFRMMTYGQGLYDLTASPDGQHVAFVVVKRGSGSTAWVASTSVGEPREIWPEWKGKWNYLSAGGALAWTPDGKGLLVSMPEAPGNQLYYLPLDGGQPHRIGIAMRSILWANLKSDGRTIAFSGSNSTSNILSLKTSLVVGVGGK